MGLWVNGPSYLFGGQRLIPTLAHWVKNPALLQLWRRSESWLRFDPWPRNFLCHRHGMARNGVKKKISEIYEIKKSDCHRSKRRPQILSLNKHSKKTDGSPGLKAIA